MIGVPSFARLPPFLPQSLPPTKDGAGLTQGPVSRELPTGLAGLAGLTVRGAWGGGGKGGSDGAGPQFFPLPGKQTKQTSPGSLAQLPPPTTTHAHAHEVLARGGMPGWVGMGRPHGASGGWALWDAEVGRVPKMGWASWHQCPTLAERRGRPPPHPPLPEDGDRSAPLAWLAPA